MDGVGPEGPKRSLLTVKHTTGRAMAKSYNLAPPLPQEPEKAAKELRDDQLDYKRTSDKVLKRLQATWMSAVNRHFAGDDTELDDLLENSFSMPRAKIFAEAIRKGDKNLLNRLFTHLSASSSIPLKKYREELIANADKVIDEDEAMEIHDTSSFSKQQRFYTEIMDFSENLKKVIKILLNDSDTDFGVFDYFYLLVKRTVEENNKYQDKISGATNGSSMPRMFTANPYTRKTGEGEFLGFMLYYLGSCFKNLRLARHILEIARNETSGRNDISDYHLIALSDPGSLEDEPNGECVLTLPKSTIAGRIEDSDEKKGKIADGRSIVKKIYASQGATPLHFAAINPDSRILRTFLRINPQQIPDARNYLPVHWTIRMPGDLINNFKIFLEKCGTPANLDVYGTVTTIGSMAAYAGNPKILQEIINLVPVKKPEYSPHLFSKQEPNPLHKSALDGENKECISIVFDFCRRNRIKVSKQATEDVMGYACQHCSLSTVEFLALDKRFSVVAPKKKARKQPLFLAVEKDKLDVVQWLFNHGVDPELEDTFGNNALFFVESKNMLNYLIACGINVNKKNNNETTPLSNFFQCGQIGLATAMLRTGLADINAPIDNDGKTALFYLLEQLSNYLSRMLDQRIKYKIDTLLNLIFDLKFDLNVITSDGKIPAHELGNVTVSPGSMNFKWYNNDIDKEKKESIIAEQKEYKKNCLLRLISIGINIIGYLPAEFEERLNHNTRQYYKYITHTNLFDNSIINKDLETAEFLWENGFKSRLFTLLDACKGKAFSMEAEMMLDSFGNLIELIIKHKNDSKKMGHFQEHDYKPEVAKQLFDEIYNRLKDNDLLHTNVTHWGHSVLFHLLEFNRRNSVFSGIQLFKSYITELLNDERILEEVETEPTPFKDPEKDAENDYHSRGQDYEKLLMFSSVNVDEFCKSAKNFKSIRTVVAKQKQEVMDDDLEPCDSISCESISDVSMQEEEYVAADDVVCTKPKKLNIFFKICSIKEVSRELEEILQKICSTYGSDETGKAKLKALLVEKEKTELSVVEFMVINRTFWFFDMIYLKNNLININDCISIGDGTSNSFIHMICEHKMDQLFSLIKLASSNERMRILMCKDENGMYILHKMCMLVKRSSAQYEKQLDDFISLICDLEGTDEYIIKLLEAQDDYGITPVHIVFSYFSSPSYNGKLNPIFYKASINIADKLGRTPVHYLFTKLPTETNVKKGTLDNEMDKLNEERADVHEVINKIANLVMDGNRCNDPTLAVSIIKDVYGEHLKQTLQTRDLFGMTPLFYALRTKAIFSFSILSNLVRECCVGSYEINGVEIYPKKELLKAHDFHGNTLLLTAIDTGSESLIQSVYMMGGNGMDVENNYPVRKTYSYPAGWSYSKDTITDVFNQPIRPSALVKTLGNNMSGVSLLLMNGCDPKYVLASAMLAGNRGFISYVLDNTKSCLKGQIAGLGDGKLHLSHILFMSSKIEGGRMVEIYKCLRERGLTFEEMTSHNELPLLMAARGGIETFKNALTCLAGDHDLEYVLTQMNTKDEGGFTAMTTLLLDNRDCAIIPIPLDPTSYNCNTRAECFNTSNAKSSIRNNSINSRTNMGNSFGSSNSFSSSRMTSNPNMNNRANQQNEQELIKKEARTEMKSFPDYISHVLEMERMYRFVLNLKQFIVRLRAKSKQTLLYLSIIEEIRCHLTKVYNIPASMNALSTILPNHSPNDELFVMEDSDMTRTYKTNIFLEIVKADNLELLMQYILTLDQDGFKCLKNVINEKISTGMSPFLAAAMNQSLKMLIFLLVLAKFINTKLDISGTRHTSSGEELFFTHMLVPNAHALRVEPHFLMLTLGAIEEGRISGWEMAYSQTEDASDVEYLHKIPGLLERMAKLGVIPVIPNRITHSPFVDNPPVRRLTDKENEEISRLSYAFHKRQLDYILEVGGEKYIRSMDDMYYVDTHNCYTRYETATGTIPLHVYGVKSVVTIALSGCSNLYYDISVKEPINKFDKMYSYIVERKYGTLDGSYGDLVRNEFGDYNEALLFFEKQFLSKFGAEWKDVSNDLKKFSNEKVKGKYRLMILKGNAEGSKDGRGVSSFGLGLRKFAKQSTEAFFMSVNGVNLQLHQMKQANKWKHGEVHELMNKFYQRLGFGPTEKSDALQKLLLNICWANLYSIVPNANDALSTWSYPNGKIAIDVSIEDLKAANKVLDTIEKLVPEYTKLRNSLNEILTHDETEIILRKVNKLQEQLAILSVQVSTLVPPVNERMSASIITTTEQLETERRRLNRMEKLNKLDEIIFAALEKGLATKTNPFDILQDYLYVGLERVKPIKYNKVGNNSNNNNNDNNDLKNIISRTKDSFTEFDIVNEYVGKCAMEIWRVENGVPYEPAGEKQYLLHGTSDVNVMGILSLGLSVTPETAFQTGKRLGFGVYLSDNMRKAGNFSRVQSNVNNLYRNRNARKYMLIVECAYDKAYELTDAENFKLLSPTLEAMPGTEATKLQGTFEPTSSSKVVDGGSVPFAVGEFRPIGKRCSDNNSEWCVYNERRLKVRYVVAMNT